MNKGLLFLTAWFCLSVVLLLMTVGLYALVGRWKGEWDLAAAQAVAGAFVFIAAIPLMPRRK